MKNATALIALATVCSAGIAVAQDYDHTTINTATLNAFF
jgi:hypothetical protein